MTLSPIPNNVRRRALPVGRSAAGALGGAALLARPALLLQIGPCGAGAVRVRPGDVHPLGGSSLVGRAGHFQPVRPLPEGVR